MEMERYNSTPEGELENDLEIELNRREINRRSADGITVVAYWLMRQNVCLIFVHDARTNSACEFEVPNDEVGEWFNHPYANRNANTTPYEQRLSNEG